MLVPQTVTYARVKLSAQLVQKDTILINPRVPHIVVLVLQTVMYARVELFAQLVGPAITSLKSIINAIAHVLQEHI